MVFDTGKFGLERGTNTHLVILGLDPTIYSEH
jgi:hypothetical protein